MPSIESYLANKYSANLCSRWYKNEELKKNSNFAINSSIMNSFFDDCDTLFEYVDNLGDGTMMFISEITDVMLRSILTRHHLLNKKALTLIDQEKSTMLTEAHKVRIKFSLLYSHATFKFQILQREMMTAKIGMTTEEFLSQQGCDSIVASLDRLKNFFKPTFYIIHSRMFDEIST